MNLSTRGASLALLGIALMTSPVLARESSSRATAAPHKSGVTQLALAPEECTTKDNVGRKRSCRMVYYKKGRKGSRARPAR